MSEQENAAPDAGQVVASHSLVVVMDQLDNGNVGFKVVLDRDTRRQVRFSARQLAERGECVAHLGIRALAYMLMDESISEALDRASALKRRAEQASRFELQQVIN